MKLSKKYWKLVLILVVVMTMFNFDLIIHLSLNKQYLVFPLYGRSNSGFDEIDSDYGWAILCIFLNTIIIIVGSILYVLKKRIKSDCMSMSKSQ